MLATFIDTQRLVFDPEGRPGIPRDCTHPQRPDYKILQMPEPPSWWKGKAYEYKEYLKQRNPGEASSDEVEYIETSGVGRPKRKAAKNLPSYLTSDSAFEDDDLEEIPVSKKTKRDTLKNLATSICQRYHD